MGGIAKWMGAHSTLDRVLTSYPAALGSILGIPNIFSEKFEFLDVVEIYRQQCIT